MNDETCWLVTVLHCGTLLRFAVKAKVSEDVSRYPMEPENREIIRAMLPDDYGPVVHVEEIFDVVVVE